MSVSVSPTPEPRWVCDGCMRSVVRSQIADYADGEHVLCDKCQPRKAQR